jgi:hypothetical protein
MQPLKMITRVSWVFQQYPILVVAGLGVQGYHLQIDLFEVDAKIAILSEGLSSLFADPAAPSFSNTFVQFN